MNFNKKTTIKRNEEHVTRYKSCDAKILYPSLGCPALVKIEHENAWLEMLIASKTKDLRLTEVAFHLRYTNWADCHGSRLSYQKLDMYKKHFQKHTSRKESDSLIRISDSYEITNDRISETTVKKDGFKLQLAHMNAFPWVLEFYREQGYTYLYKVAVNLKHEPDLCVNGMFFNIVWLEEEINKKATKKPSLLKIISDRIVNLMKGKRKYTNSLSEFGIKLSNNDDIIATFYNPVYVSNKNRLDIGHITDLHLDTRMELYSKSVSSVIEVKENCQVEIENGKRVVRNKKFYTPLKHVVANFNELFINISGKLLGKSDVLVITGDLIDYNKGVHTEQTFRNIETKPSEIWEKLKPKRIRVLIGKFDNVHHVTDRNWFLFYRLLLKLYDKHKKPIFTMLGNHDYVKHAMAPWPLFGVTWNGVYDTNLTRYENALCFGEGYNHNVELMLNGRTNVDCVKWYTQFINPFPDYVVEYGDQSMFMVDWGEAGQISTLGAINDVTSNTMNAKVPYNHPGSLHHAVNLFREKSEFEQPLVAKDKNGTEIHYLDKHKDEIANPYTRKSMPFLIKNYTIYKSWINGPSKVKMLFTHATTICPRDDISVGEINNFFKWTAEELKYGTFNHRRDEILQDIEKGKLHIAVGGHSHRNLVMEVSEAHKYHARTIAAGEAVNTDFMEPRHIALVTSSAGPLPKYLPGGPLVCACMGEHNTYNTGFSIDKKSGQLYYQDDYKKNALNRTSCYRCTMRGKDMSHKPARRHKPGGNLLIFENGKVKIESVVPDDDKITIRKAVMCEEQGVFVGDMQLEHIDSYRDFKNWDEMKPINIISVKPFTYYGYMEFPSEVKYVTYKKGDLQGSNKVELIPKVYSNRFIQYLEKDVLDKKFEYRVLQQAIKDSFDALYQSAISKSDFAFTRYSFNISDYWDREINIDKKLFADVKDKTKISVNNAVEKTKSVVAKTFEKKYDPKYQEYMKDDFRGMLLLFRTIPDFKKRKKSNVCGY